MKNGVALGAFGGVAGGAALLAYGVRGRSSRLFGPSVHRGPRELRAIALTFDDGPSESTPRLLDSLARHGVPATLFQCGANVRRLPAVARAAAAAGHEIGNHSDTHPAFYFRSAADIYAEFARAQETLADVTGRRPELMRAPYGARWFGFRAMQRELGLLGVMWTVIGRDWTLDAAAVAQRVVSRVRNGAIVCLHDGRGLEPNPDISATLAAVDGIVPSLLDRGFAFRTVSALLAGGRSRPGPRSS